MRHFYERVRDGDTRAEALWSAQKGLLADPATTHPYFWAAFALSGDFRTFRGEDRRAGVVPAVPAARGCGCAVAGESDGGAPLALLVSLALLRWRAPGTLGRAARPARARATSNEQRATSNEQRATSNEQRRRCEGGK